MNTSRTKNITLPRAAVHGLLRQLGAIQDMCDELEDSLLLQDKDFIEKMKQGRKEHQAGRVKPLAALSAAYVRD